MSFWSSLGLPGSPLSAGVETLAQWIQWAMAGINAGISGTSRWIDADGYSHSDANEDLIRYNLGQFWTQKDAVLAAAGSEDEKRQIYRLDSLSHGLLNALDSGKLYSTPPSYWSYLQVFLTGGTPARPETAAIAAEARTAAIDASEAAYNAGIRDLGDYFLAESDRVAVTLANSNEFWKKPGVMNVGGVPWWAWIGGALGVYILVNRVLK